MCDAAAHQQQKREQTHLTHGFLWGLRGSAKRDRRQYAPCSAGLARWVQLPPRCGAGSIKTREIIARCQSPRADGWREPVCYGRGVLHVQCEVYSRSYRARCNRYIYILWCSRDVLLLLLLLLLLALYSCVVADSRRGKGNLADVVQRVK